jgi:phage terminase large subunit-like protein
MSQNEWIRTEADRAAVAAGFHFDLSRALRVRRFFERCLKHSKGQWRGEPFRLMDWQWNDVIAPLFGWVDGDGFRRYRTAYIEIAKKNGKSTIGAGIGMYMLCADGEPGAEVYSAATKLEQARIVHSEAERMVNASPALRALAKINRATKTITYEDTDSKYAALASDSQGSEGLNIHGLIVDELHAWSDRDFWNTLRYGMAARRQPLTFIITTAGIADHTSLGWETHDYAAKVLDGTIEDLRYFSYIRAAAPDDDLADPETAKKANPSYNILIRPEEIAKAVQDAIEKPSEWTVLQRYRFNLWVQQVIRWITLEQWDICKSESDDAELKRLPCWGGLDLASTRDMTAWALVFRDDNRYVIRPRFFVPEDTAKWRSRHEQLKYDDWIARGLVQVTPGPTIDYRAIRNQINADALEYDLQQIGYDKWNASQLITELVNDGYKCEMVPQTMQGLTAPTKEMEAAILSGRLGHDGNEVLRWMMSNVALKTDPDGNVKPDKDASTEKIDGVRAILNALALILVSPADAGNIYDHGGDLLVV